MVRYSSLQIIGKYENERIRYKSLKSIPIFTSLKYNRATYWYTVLIRRKATYICSVEEGDQPKKPYYFFSDQQIMLRLQIKGFHLYTLL